MTSFVHLSIVYPASSSQPLEQDVLLNLAEPNESTGNYLRKLVEQQHGEKNISGKLEFFCDERQTWITVGLSRKLAAEGLYKFTFFTSTLLLLIILHM
jgi:hypothetical protein